jgi:hypothetical protein
MIRIDKTKTMGRGIFANCDIKYRSIVEISPVIIIPKRDIKKIDNTIIETYVYGWYNNCAVIALGIGSLFNHSEIPNVQYFIEGTNIVFETLKPISKNDELYIDYGYDPRSLIKRVRSERRRENETRKV